MKNHVVISAVMMLLLPAAIRVNAYHPLVRATVENRVKGSFTYKQETVTLKHAYARLNEGRAKHERPFITLLFTDRPITEAVAEHRLEHKARSGDLKGLSVKIDRLTRSAESYSIYAGGTVMTSSNDADITLRLNDPDLVGGVASIKGDELAFDITFEAAVKKNEWTGVFELFPPVKVAAGRAAGKMIYGGRTQLLNYVYAQEETDMFDEKDRKVRLVFTELPYSPNAPRKEHAPYLEFTMNRKNLLGLNIIEEQGNASYASSTFDIDFIFLPQNAVEGRFSVKKERVLSKYFECSLAFKAVITDDANTPVTAGTGTALAAGGGLPGTALLEFIKEAQAAGHYVDAQIQEARLDALSKENTELKKYRFQGRGSLIYMAGGLDMKGVRITSGFTNGQKATLHIIIPNPKGRAEGRINMHLENDLWKVGKLGIKDKDGTSSYN